MSQRRRQLDEGVKTVTGIIVLVYERRDMAAFSPAHNTEHACCYYIYTPSSQILCILPLAFLQMAALLVRVQWTG